MELDSRSRAAVVIRDRHESARAVLGRASVRNRTTGTKTETAEDAVSMFDAQGKLIWQAPEKQEEGK
jgi:hypothetical protein